MRNRSTIQTAYLQRYLKAERLGNEIAMGLVNYSSSDLQKICGRHQNSFCNSDFFNDAMLDKIYNRSEIGHNSKELVLKISLTE